MDLEKFGIKELYEATLKATYNMKIGKKNYEAGENILFFEKLQIGNISQESSVVAAKGGKSNLTRIVWENYSDLIISINAGVVSKSGLSSLLSTGVVDSSVLAVPKNLRIEFDGDGKYDLGDIDLNSPVFVYVQDTNGVLVKTSNYTITNGLLECDDAAYKQGFISYYYSYEDGGERLSIDKGRFNGVFRFEGKAYYKDTDAGVQKTALFVAPKVSVISNLRFMLGEKANPLLSTFNMVAIPGKVFKNEDDLIIDIQLLDSDIDSDI